MEGDLHGERFDRFHEVKSHEDGKKVIRFILVNDQTGREHVAAYGEDHGGSHYNYHAMPGFKALLPFKGHNRRDVIAWLDILIKDSQDRHPQAPCPGPAALPQPLPHQMAPLPAAGVQQQQQQQQVQWHQQQQQQHQWHQQQQQQLQQAAAQHQGPMVPVQGHQVDQEAMAVQGPGGAPPPNLQVPTVMGPPAKAAVMSPGSKGQASGKGGANKASGMKHRLVGVAHEAHLKKLRRIAAEGQEALRAAQSAYLLRLRRIAAVEAAQREGARNLTAGWVRGEPSEEELGVLSQWLASLKDLLHQANKKQMQVVQYVEVHLPMKLGQLMDRAQPQIELQGRQATTSVRNGPVLVVTYGDGDHKSTAGEPVPNGCGDSGVSGNGIQDVNQEEGAKQWAHGSGAEASASGGDDESHGDGLEKVAGNGQQGVQRRGTRDEGCIGQEGGSGQLRVRGGGGSHEGCQREGSLQPGQAHTASLSGTGALEGESGKADQGAWPHAHGLPGKILEARTWSYADPYLHKHGVRIILECLRELGALGLPMKALIQGDIISTVKSCAESHPHPAVSRLAKQILGRWQRAVLQHVASLVSHQALRDPVAELETQIALNQISYPEEIVAMQHALRSQHAMLQQELNSSASHTQVVQPGTTNSLGLPTAQGAQGEQPGGSAMPGDYQQPGAANTPTVPLPFPSSLLNDLTSMGTEAALEMLGKSVGAGHGGDPHNPAPATLGAAPPAPALTGVEVANPGTLGISPAASSPPIACEPLALPELPVGASGIPPGWEGNDVPSPGPMQL